MDSTNDPENGRAHDVNGRLHKLGDTTEPASPYIGARAPLCDPLLIEDLETYPLPGPTHLTNYLGMTLLKVKRLRESALLPKRASAYSAGYDLFTPFAFQIDPGHTLKICLGFEAEIPSGYAGLIWDRSSLGARGVHVHGGVIDSDYRGEWTVVLHNHADESIKLDSGDRIAQVLIQHVGQFGVVEIQKLSGTARGAGGFGSTGK